MDRSTIQTSEKQIEAETPPSFDDFAGVVDQMEPTFEIGDPASEDNIEIEDEALIAAAACGCTTGPPDRRPERVALFKSCVLAIFMHAAVAAICYLLLVRVLAPRLSFTQGSGTAQSGLVSVMPQETESQESSLPGPAVAQPQAQVVDAKAHTDDEGQSKPGISFKRTLLVTSQDAESLPPDSVVLGVAAPPVGPVPVTHRSKKSDVVSAAANSTPTLARAGVKTGDSGRRGNAVAATHSIVAPRGAGRPGMGAKGSELDSRGLPVPEYPSESINHHEEGVVELEVQVRTDGSVGAARIVKGSFPRLNDCAMKAIRSARFTPETIDGVPVAARVTVPFVFTIN